MAPCLVEPRFRIVEPPCGQQAPAPGPAARSWSISNSALARECTSAVKRWVWSTNGAGRRAPERMSRSPRHSCVSARTRRPGRRSRDGSLLLRSLERRCAMVLTSPPYGSSVHGRLSVPRGVLVKRDLSYSDDVHNLTRARSAGLAAPPEAAHNKFTRLFDQAGDDVEGRKALLRHLIEEIRIESPTKITPRAFECPCQTVGRPQTEVRYRHRPEPIRGRGSYTVKTGTPGGTRTPAPGSGGRRSIRLSYGRMDGHRPSHHRVYGRATHAAAGVSPRRPPGT